MLTNERIDYLSNTRPDNIYLQELDQLCAQAREANELRKELAAAQAELAQWKQLAEQRAAGYDARRCSCVFDSAKMDDPTRECDYHKEWRERAERYLRAIFAMADDGWLAHGVEGMSDTQKLVYEIVKEHPEYKKRAALAEKEPK